MLSASDQCLAGLRKKSSRSSYTGTGPFYSELYGFSVHWYINVVLLLSSVPVKLLSLTVWATSRDALATRFHDEVIAFVNQVARLRLESVEVRWVKLAHRSDLFLHQLPGGVIHPVSDNTAVNKVSNIHKFSAAKLYYTHIYTVCKNITMARVH